MAPTDNSFTDNLSAIDRIYAERAEVETDADGNIPHIDVDNENMDGPPVDLANVGVPVAEVTEPEEGEDRFVVADHNIEEVKDFIRDHPDLRYEVLETEQARGDDARVTLVEWLAAETTPEEDQA